MKKLMPSPYSQQQPQTIQELFDSIAKSYDRTNTLMSLGLHKRWNRALVAAVSFNVKGVAENYLDLCCGTGAIAYDFVEKNPCCSNAHLLDFSEKMLAVARAKKGSNSRCSFHYLHADAQEIPLDDESVCAVTIAYGIRNIENRRRCFNDIYRVLRRGGCVGILELTRPQLKVMRFGHSFYLKVALPLIGRLSTGNRKAYEYLAGSINSFIDPHDLTVEMKQAGFAFVSSYPLIFGLAHVFVATKGT